MQTVAAHGTPLRRRRCVRLLLTGPLLLLPVVQARPIVVASKPFAESFLLGEMFAQLLEARGYVVDRRLGLGATEIAFGALRQGSIDVYPDGAIAF
jgi:glycine betaine/choline ABC-type transport system substrate-binding protein